MVPRTLLVIPCYHESKRLPGFLPELCEEMRAQGLAVEVQVVDDGSGPEEQAALARLLQPFQEAHAFVRPLLACPVNAGKGAAVYAGWEASAGFDFLAFVDADGAVPAREVRRVLALTYDAACAGTAIYAVRVPGAGRTVSRTVLRQLSGQVFRWLVRLLFALPVPDTQCGFKVIPAHAYRAISSRLREHRFCFDVELTCELLSSGTPILPVPIDWAESPGSRVRPATVKEMVLSLLRLRRRLSAGPHLTASENSLSAP